METIVTKPARIVRSEEEIFNLLDEYEKSDVSVKEFCEIYDIVEATFYNWKNKYRSKPEKQNEQAGFAALEITPSPVSMDTALFAEVRGIKIYQPVPASYLKELSHE